MFRFVILACATLAVAALPASAQQPQRLKTEKAEIVVETVARGLDSPWGLAFLPDGRILVTEKSGRLRIVSADGQTSPPLGGVPRVYAQG
jgi:glucose/arabinose dehydrogenase